MNASSETIDYAAVLAQATADPRYARCAAWGEPRPGHPEGTIAAHIAELEEIFARLAERRARAGRPLTETEQFKLRLLIHTHDLFKGEAREGAAIEDADSHASLARAFLAEFCSDEGLLSMVQLHDVPYALWRQHKSRGSYNAERLQNLLETIDDWPLFAAFLLVDGSTAGKSRAPLAWFFEKARDRVALGIEPGEEQA